MRRRAAWLVLAGVLAFVVAALWMLPAEVAVRLTAGRIAPLQLAGVSGTAWHGQARQASVFGQPVGRLEWWLRPLPLLLGRTEAELRLDGPALRASTRLSESGEQLRLSDLHAEFPARLLGPVLGVPALSLRGAVSVDATEMLIADGLPRRVAGEGRWREAGVTGAANAEFGDIAFRFAGEDTVAGEISDAGGPLMVDGRFTVALSGYDLDLQLRARDDDPAVGDALRWLGQPQPDGSTRLLVQGGLRPW